MRRRILFAIVAVTAIATAALTVPLSIIIARRGAAEAVLELDRVAQRSEIGVSGRTGSDAADAEPIELPEVEGNIEIGVYALNGDRIAGAGPPAADAVTSRVRGLAVNGVVGADRVLASPVIVNEQTVAVIRVAEPAAETTARVRRDILLLLLFDLGAVAFAAAVGWFVAARLAKPIRIIRDDAVRLGDGDFSIVAHRSGIAELDDTAEALASTAGVLGTMLTRERSFSADASHELRTPLAALRLSIETELLDHRDDPDTVLQEALVQIDRLASTVTTLLDIARDRPVERAPLDAADVLSGLSERWTNPLAARSRAIRCIADDVTPAHASRAVLDQVLDILVGNAVDHGSGDVTVRFTASADGVTVTVSDQGRLDRDPQGLFTRRDPGATGNGVGLSLARSLAEAEGGRLILTGTEPTTFSLLIPGSRPARSNRPQP